MLELVDTDCELSDVLIDFLEIAKKISHRLSELRILVIDLAFEVFLEVIHAFEGVPRLLELTVQYSYLAVNKLFQNTYFVLKLLNVQIRVLNLVFDCAKYPMLEYFRIVMHHLCNILYFASLLFCLFLESDNSRGVKDHFLL